MELLYIWVRKYGCFNNAGFNLSPKHRFIFDSETSTMEYYQNENTIENFFNNYENPNIRKGNILNINAIVGNNGSGKTTLLEIIFSNLVYGEGGIRVESIFIFNSKGTNNNNKIRFYYNYKFGNLQPKPIELKHDILQC